MEYRKGDLSINLWECFATTFLFISSELMKLGDFMINKMKKGDMYNLNECTKRKMKIFKKLVLTLTVLAMVFTLTGCKSETKGSDNDSSGNSGGNLKKVMFVVTGNLGGGTNNDDVYATISDFVKTVGGTVDTFECNMDASLYESTLMQVAESGEYDLIVTGFGTMIEPLGNTALKYPKQKFLIFDTAMDYSTGANSNVVSVQVLQNQGGFLAGVMAALLTTSDAELANEEKVVGFVGAIESTAILDFLMGYIDGVNYVDPSIEVLYSFVGNHTDSALAKELGLAQYQRNADIIFVCGGNGMGVAEAALDANKYVIGVDFDYAARLEETSKETAGHVVTSVIKDYKGMVYPILEKVNDATIEWGTHSYIPFADGGVYLVKNDYTNNIVPEQVWTEYDKVVEQLTKGEISISSAFGASTEEIEAVKSKAKSQ